MKKINWGELSIPALAILYAIYTLGPQITNNYHPNTIRYGLMLSLPIFICTIIIILSMISKEKLRTESPKLDVKKYKTMIFSVILVIVFLLFLNKLGYIISFFVYLAVFLWLMGNRSLIKIITVSVAVTIFIHFVFATWLGVPLPAGILETIL